MKKIILPFILVCSINLYAQEENSSYLDLIIKETKDYRKYIHETLIDTSSSIDNYYFDEKVEKDKYQSTYAFLELSAFQNQHESIKFDQKLKIKFQLPKLKKRLKLVLESEEERESKDYVEDHRKNKDDDYNLSLLFNKNLKDNIDFKAKAGIKLKSKIDPFLKLNFKKNWKDSNEINYTLSQSFKQSVIKKLEATSSFKITKKLTDTLSLNNYNQYYWQSGYSKDSEFYHSIYLNQKLSNKNYLTYQIDTNIDNIQSNIKIKRYSAKVKYRHFIKKWLYTDVIPENYYKEELDFKPRYAIRFNLGVFFNKESY